MHLSSHLRRIFVNYRPASLRRIRRLATGVLMICTLGLLGEQASVHAATALYVSPTGNDANDCLSVSTACQTINGAIDKSASGDTIYLAAGIYHETLLILDKNLTISGGGAADTIVDGGKDWTVISTGTTTTITYLTIRNGIRGVANWGVLTLANVIIIDNTLNGSGSGILNDGTLTANNVTIKNNTASYYGGGFYNHTNAIATLTNVRVTNNIAIGGAGGILIRHPGRVTMNNVVIHANRAPGPDPTGSGFGIYGGGIVNDGTLAMTDSTVSDNTAQYGGGIRNDWHVPQVFGCFAPAHDKFLLPPVSNLKRID